MSEEADRMPGVKRNRDGEEKEMGNDVEEEVNPFTPMFKEFRDDLDEHHDRRERIIKASRDITATSKKIVRTLNQPIPPAIAKEVAVKKVVIQKSLESIAPDLQGVHAWRYQRQISGGIQELMEAISFEHYLQTQTLIDLETASKALPSSVLLTGDDYVLGIFDLVGELMRFAITTMATTGKLPASKNVETGEERTILMDLRDLRSRFEGLDTSSGKAPGLGKGIEKKMSVMRESVQKVETAVYGMIIRGRERPKGWIQDLSQDQGRVESY